MKHKNLHVIQGIDFQRIEAAEKCLGKPKVFRALPGGDFVGKKKFYDCWRYDNLQFEGGNIYALVGEFGEGCMYLSYLLGGKVDFGDLKIYINGSEIKKQDLKLISRNLEPMEERYDNMVVKKSIEKALDRNKSKESFSDIQKFGFNGGNKYEL